MDGRLIPQPAGPIEILGLHTLDWVTPVLYAREGVQELFSLRASPESKSRSSRAKMLTPGRPRSATRPPGAAHFAPVAGRYSAATRLQSVTILVGGRSAL